MVINMIDFPPDKGNHAMIIVKTSSMLIASQSGREFAAAEMGPKAAKT